MKSKTTRILCLLLTVLMVMGLYPAYAESPVAEIEDEIYQIPGVDTSLLRQNGGKFYPATATKAEADALADLINRQINDEGQVLLHNDGVLPLDSADRKITLMGVASQEIVVAGGGSGSASQNAQSICRLNFCGKDASTRFSMLGCPMLRSGKRLFATT